MDKVDWTILECLEADGRESYTAIAERISLSKTPTWKRVQALERAGVIKGYRAVIDADAVGLRLTAFVEVTIEFGSRIPFERAVGEHPAIIECYTIAGESDYLLQVLTSDVERLDYLLREELCRLPGVKRSITNVCLKRIKDNGPITRAGALWSQPL
jgi:Lrp/AsnC family transcriptional regulator, leucine-responsive regulatory protein